MAIKASPMSVKVVIHVPETTPGCPAPIPYQAPKRAKAHFLASNR